MRPDARLRLLLVTPLTLVIGFTVIAPAVILFFYSFFRFRYLERVGSPTLSNYISLLGDPTFWRVTSNTVAIAVPTSLLSVAGGFTIAFFMVSAGRRVRAVLFALVVSALTASYLVRVYAWRTLLGESGIINSGLLAAHVIKAPISALLFTRTSAVLAEINLFMPFSALTMFVALAGIPTDVGPAARDLGATRMETLVRVTLPLSGRALMSSLALTFFMSCGDYVTPALVGGTGSLTIGTVIASYFGSSGQYGMGAALSYVLVTGFVAVYLVLWAAFTSLRLLPRSVR